MDDLARDYLCASQEAELEAAFPAGSGGCVCGGSTMMRARGVVTGRIPGNVTEKFSPELMCCGSLLTLRACAHANDMWERRS